MAGLGSVVIAESTRLLLGDLFEFQELGAKIKRIDRHARRELQQGLT